MNLEKCRACLKKEDTMYSLFDIYEHDLTLAVILQNCLTVEVDEEDNLPPYICFSCTSTLINFYNFAIIYEKNEKKLKTILQKQENDNQQILNDSDYTKDLENQTCVEDISTNIVKNENLKLRNNNAETVIIECTLDYTEKVSEDNSNSCEYDDVKHIDSKKVSNGNFKCKLCKKEFSDFSSLDAHKTSHKIHICEICGSSFIKKAYLDDHKEGHLNETRYMCTHCGKKFKRRTVLVKHKRLHTNPRECICEMCGKCFNDKGTLKTHILLVHIKARNFVCVICNQNFPLKATLDKHLRRHQKRDKDYVCDQCHMEYSDKSSLTRHYLIKHSNVDNRVKCEECGKRYTTSTNLLKHKQKHHPDKTENKIITS